VQAARTASLNRRRADGVQYVAAARELRRRSEAVLLGRNMLGAVGGVGVVGVVVIVLVVLAILYFVRRR
jgi:hypothetical protein